MRITDKQYLYSFEMVSSFVFPDHTLAPSKARSWG